MRRGSWAALAPALRAFGGAFVVFAGALADTLEAVGDKPADDSDPWVRPVAYLRGAIPARVVNSACAGGEIGGAVKRGKSWLCRKSAADSWIESSRGADEDEDVAATLARWTGRAA